MGRRVYRGFLEGVPVAELRLILQQGGAAGDAPVAACESAVRSIRSAFAQPGALERLLHPPGPLTAFAVTAISERAGWAVRAARAAVPSLLPIPRARSVS